jgi:hypothetical protein
MILADTSVWIEFLRNNEDVAPSMRKLLEGKTTAARVTDERGKVLCAKGRLLDAETMDGIPPRYWPAIELEDAEPDLQHKLEH